MLTGKRVRILSALFAISIAFRFYKIAHGKRVADIYGCENSNNLLEELLLEPTFTTAKYSHSLSLQSLISAFLLKGSLEELSIFPFYTTTLFSISCRFLIFFSFQIFFYFMFLRRTEEAKNVSYFTFYVVFCSCVLKFFHKSNTILFLN